MAIYSAVQIATYPGRENSAAPDPFVALPAAQRGRSHCGASAALGPWPRQKHQGLEEGTALEPQRALEQQDWWYNENILGIEWIMISWKTTTWNHVVYRIVSLLVLGINPAQSQDCDSCPLRIGEMIEILNRWPPLTLVTPSKIWVSRRGPSIYSLH
jgi:hypothetical protein